MGRAHSNAWLNVGKFFECTATGDAHGRPQRAELEHSASVGDGCTRPSDWRSGVTEPRVGLVDIGTPNHLRAGQAIAALEAGKHVAC